MLHYQDRAFKISTSSLKCERLWGQKTALWGSKNPIIVYAGQYYDSETGLHYNYHRYYDPSLGRYLRADPIGLAGGINLYAYVQNNPINAIDPYGLTTGVLFYSVGPGAPDPQLRTYSDEDLRRAGNELKHFVENYVLPALLYINFPYLMANTDGDGSEKKKSKRRDDCEVDSLDDAIEEAKRRSGDQGQEDWVDIIDIETGELIGRESPGSKEKQRWRVDSKGHAHDPRPHVNWDNWKGGKRKGGYGHAYYPKR